MHSYKEFKNEVINKRYDIDGYYGAQCWDGFAYYCKYLGIPIIHCTKTGYVKDIYLNKSTNGILKYCTETQSLKPGDIVVFQETNVTPDSHIAIFDSDAGNGYGWFLGQNQGGYNGAFNIVKLPYSATYQYAFRPKAFKPTIITEWDNNAVLKVGDTVAAFNLKIKDVKGTNVKIPALGGYVPLDDIYENDKTKDGKNDNYLANQNAIVNLHETEVKDIDAKNNLIKIHDYWVNASALCKKVVK